jgi:hypothetical protein
MANVPVQSDDHIWHKLDSESEEQYKWFSWYLQLGPKRKITMLPERHVDSPSVTRLNKTSSNYRWIERAKAYDEYQIVKRRELFEERLDSIMADEFDELESAFKTSHILRKRIENDTKSSTYSLLNAWKNWVDAHGKITEEMHQIAGVSLDQNSKNASILEAWEKTETQTITDNDKIQEVTKALRMIQQN